MDSTVRLANENDKSVIIDFQLKMATETENLNLDFTIVSQGVSNVFLEPKHGVYYVCELDGEIAGVLLTTYEWSDWRNATIIWIQSVYVLPAFRKFGVFKTMYAHIKQMVLHSPAYCGIRLYVDITNKTAQKVYEAVGMNGNHYSLFEDMKA